MASSSEASIHSPAYVGVRRAQVAALAVYVLAYLAWQLLRSGGPDEQRIIGDLAFLPLTGFAAVCAWQAGGRCRTIAAMTRAWRLIALAVAFYGLGDIAQLCYEAGSGQPSPSLSDPLYLAFYPLFLAGILQFPRAPQSRSRRLRAALDATTIALGGGAIVWYVVLGPNAYASPESTLSAIVSVSYPIGDIVLIVALARLLTDLRQPAARLPLQLLAAGLTLYVVGDVVYGWLLLHSGYTGGNPVDCAWLLATALFALAAQAQGTPNPATRTGHPRADEVSPEPDEASVELDEAFLEQEREGSFFGAATPTYLATIAVFALLVCSQADDRFFPGLSLTLTATATGLLVLLRQLLARRELAGVHAQLRMAHVELEALATTDPLTELPNHRALVAAIDRELEGARRHARTCALVFFDIDHFKELNDSSGHAAGDEALRELGAVARDSLRAVDTLGRWGGEEFIAVLPDVGARDATASAERIRAAIAQHHFATADGTPLTVSVGVAAYPSDGTTRRELLGAADRAMYRAKRTGRDRVCAAIEPALTASGSVQ